MLFFSSAENRAHLVNLRSKTIVRTYSASAAGQHGIVFSPLTKHVIVHQENGCSAFFGFQTQQVLQRSFTSETIRSSAVTSCGSFILGGGENGNMFVWSAHTGQLVRFFSAHFRGINCLQCSLDNSVVITCSEDSTCKVWLLSSLTSLKLGIPNPVTVFSRHTLPVVSCAFLNETKLAITGSEDKTCKIFHALSGREQLSFSVGGPITYAIGSSHIIAVGTVNGCVHLIHIGSGENDQTTFLVINCNPTGDSPSPVVFICFHADDPSLLLVALRNGSIRSYSALNGAPRDEILSLKKSIFSVCYITDASPVRQKELKLNKNPLDLCLSSYLVSSTQSKDCSSEASDLKRTAAEEQLLNEVQELQDLKRNLRQKLRLSANE